MDDSVQKRFCAQCKELELERVLVHLCLRQLNPRLCFLNPWTAFWAIYRLLPVKIIGIISSLSVVNYSPVSKEDHGLRLRRTMEGVSHTLISHFNQYGHSDWHCCSVWKHKVHMERKIMSNLCWRTLKLLYIFVLFFLPRIHHWPKWGGRLPLSWRSTILSQTPHQWVLFRMILAAEWSKSS